MKRQTFERGSIYIERCVTREGPSPYFIVHWKSTSRAYTDPKAVIRMLRLGRGTQTRNDLMEWFDSFEPKEEQPELDTERIASEGFGPEAVELEEDPTHATKMVV